MYAAVARNGCGGFRGDDIPFGGSSGNALGAWTAYARIGGDIGDNVSWRLGGSVLSGEAEGGRETNEDEVIFIGDQRIYIADFRAIWTPTGNPRQQEVILQGEYFWNDEDGTYEDTNAGTGQVAFDDKTSGWYAQAVYKFDPQWRIGARYSKLNSADTPVGLIGSALDADDYDPRAYAVMIAWPNSEFGRIRAQGPREEVARAGEAHPLSSQSIMSLRAHPAHAQ